MQTSRLVPGSKFPALSWPTPDMDRVAPAEQQGWRVLVVYRGRHCPLCKAYLNTLDELLDDLQGAGIAVSAVSADTQEKAVADLDQYGWRFPVGYGLTPDEMRQLGLFVSEPRSRQETDRPFSEPGLFILNADGEVHVVDVSNAPYARPDLKALVPALKMAIERNYPIRGRG